MPNNDLISRAAAIAEIEEYIDEYSELDLITGYHNLKWCAMEEAKDVLLTLPAVDTVPVVHGRWIKLAEAPEWDQRRCTVCGDVSCCQRNYCPNCGAKMDSDGDPDGLSVATREPLSESGREMPKCEVTKDG